MANGNRSDQSREHIPAIHENTTLVREDLQLGKDVGAIRCRDVATREPPKAAGKSPPIGDNSQGLGALGRFLIVSVHGKEPFERHPKTSLAAAHFLSRTG